MHNDQPEDGGQPKRLDLDDPLTETKWMRAEIPCQKVRHALAIGHEERARTLVEEAIVEMRRLEATHSPRSPEGQP